MEAAHVHLDLHFVGSHLSGTEVVSLRRAGPLSEIAFRLPAGLHVKRAVVDGSTWPLTQTGAVARLLLGRPAATATLQLEYSGRPAAPSRIATDAVALFAGSWHPVFEGAYETTLTLATRPGWDVVTAGERQSADSSGRQTWQVSSGAKAGLFLAPHIPRVERAVPGLTVDVFGAADPTSLRQAADVVVALFQHLSGRLGSPAHTPVVQILFAPQAPLGIVGTSTLLVFREPGDLQRVAGRARFAVTEALAQSWLRAAPLDIGAIAAPDPQIASPLSRQDAWLNAGIPAALALDVATQAGGPGTRVLWLHRLQAAAQGWRHPLAEGPGATTDADSGFHDAPASSFTARATLTLNALRLEVGDERFWALLRQLVVASPTTRVLEHWATPAALKTAIHPAIRTHPRRSYRPTQLERAVALQQSEARERDLAWFWPQWLERPGLPNPEFEWRRTRMPRSGNALTVRIRQTGTPFWFRAPIVIVSGKHRLIQWVQVRNAETVLAIPFRGVLDAVEFDPDLELLRSLPSADDDE